MYFGKYVDKQNRASMSDFLKNHFRYYTMNSWNQSTSYANKVKVYDLPIPTALRDRAFDVACGVIQSPEFQLICEDEMQEFTNDTGYFAAFNGRSSGYIVMIDSERNYKTGKLVSRPGRNIDQYEDFDDKDEWPMTRLRERVELVQRFDQMCENILNRFIEMLRSSEIETVTEVITKQHQVLVPSMYFDIHVKYNENNGYSIFLPMPANSTAEEAIARAVSKHLFTEDDDKSLIDHVSEISREEYLQATQNTAE